MKKSIRLSLASSLGDAKLMDLRSKGRSKSNLCRKQGVEQKPSIFIVGCPDYGNLGDHAIAIAQRKFISSRTGIKPVSFYGSLEQYWEELHSLVREGDIICLQGGGNMGTMYEAYENERLAIIDRFKRNRIVLFPQTISYGSSSHERRFMKHVANVYGSHPDLHLVARERMSLERMRRLFPVADVLLTPDIVLSLPPFEDSAPARREGLCLCLRADKERRIDANVARLLSEAAAGKFGGEFSTDTMHANDRLSPKEGELAVLDKIAELARARLVVTDRIHGMIFCALSGTPCIALDNSNGKVGMEYEWLKNLSYIRFARNVKEAVAMLEDEPSEQGWYPSESFSPLFDPLASLLV